MGSYAPVGRAAVTTQGGFGTCATAPVVTIAAVREGTREENEGVYPLY